MDLWGQCRLRCVLPIRLGAGGDKPGPGIFSYSGAFFCKIGFSLDCWDGVVIFLVARVAVHSGLVEVFQLLFL